MQRSIGRVRPLGVLLAVGFALVVAGAPAPAVRGAPSVQAPPSCQNPAPTIAAAGDGVTPALASALAGLPAALTSAAAKLPGLSIAVVLDQQIVFAAGFGCADIEKGIAATPRTIYEIESITKVFDATMAMQQRDAGKYALTDTVDTYVPQVHYKLMNGQQFSPSFLELASHTAGLPDAVPNASTLAQFWQDLENVTAIDAPGTYSYSDFGFITLNQAVSIIAGQEYHDYVAANIFNPLGMTTATYDYTPLLGNPALAIPYTGSMGNWRPAAPMGYQQPFPPAGSIFTTVEDMAQMIMLQFRTGSAGGSQILACTSVQEMWQPVAPTQGSGHATIGWFNNAYGPNLTLISKNGGDSWWSTLARFIPELRLGVVAFANTGSGGATLGAIEQAVFKALVPALTPNPPVCSQ
ncbi:MAG: serine hydrolase domain-containing protein [Dehalococcoidia bacterium]